MEEKEFTLTKEEFEQLKKDQRFKDQLKTVGLTVLALSLLLFAGNRAGVVHFGKLPARIPINAEILTALGGVIKDILLEIRRERANDRLF